LSEHEAWRRIDGDIGRGLLLICDHAENTIPAEYGSLGLPAEELERHIAYDIGAAAVTERLARRLGVPAVLSRFSRLLIDPNRGADDPTLVMRLSDGAVVPGNARIDEDEIARRTERFWRPYHAAISAEIDRGVAMGRPPAILSLHSFTPQWKSILRLWSVTVLWDRDPRLPRRLLDALRSKEGLIVGENEPYDGALENDCLYTHGTLRGLAHALVELRQDLIRNEDGQVFWADMLAGIIEQILADKDASRDLSRIVHYDSNEDGEGRDAGRRQEVA
jgi:predicted N-formylglutamate amidohydrolase